MGDFPVKELQCFYNEPMRSREHKFGRKGSQVCCGPRVGRQSSHSKSMRQWGKRLCLLALLGSLISSRPLAPHAQTLDHRSGGRGQISGPEDPPDEASIHMQERQQKLLNDLRQKRLVSDADKLLSLAGELRSEVSAPEKVKTSTSSLRKADEIEKLARNIRDKMKAF